VCTTEFIAFAQIYEELRKRGEVMVLSRTRSGRGFIKGDITDYPSLEKAMRGCNYVYHLAAFGKHFAGYGKHYRTNVLGTENVLRAAVKNNVKKAVVFGSAAADVRWKTNYGKSKLEAEKVIDGYSEKMDIVLLKPAYVYDDKKALGFGKIKYFPFPRSGMKMHFTCKKTLVKAAVNALSAKPGKYYVVDRSSFTMKELHGVFTKFPAVLPGFLVTFFSYFSRFFAFLFSKLGLDAVNVFGFLAYALQDREFDSAPAADALRYEPEDTLKVFRISSH
jgi:nucleoside-diphosphate-sugar epimerase